MNWKHVFLACGVLGTFGAAHADIKYTTEMTVEGASDSMPKTITVRAVKPNFERSEMRQQIGAFQMNHISIRDCEKKHTIKLEPALKLYTVVPDGGASAADGQDNRTGAPSTPKTGKMVMTYAVQDLGEEEVAGFKTRRYMIDTEMVSTGCAGNGTNKMKQEIWVSDIRDAYPCVSDSMPGSVSEAMSRSDCKITLETKGDFAKYSEIYKGLILRTKMYHEGKVMMTTEVTSLSQAKIEDDSLFTIPAGFKQVSEEEFQQAQTQAMMKAMMGGAMGGN